LTLNTVGIGCEPKTVSFKGAKHAMTEGIPRFYDAPGSIEACKSLKTKSFSLW
jgi:hypothetical protein